MVHSRVIPIVGGEGEVGSVVFVGESYDIGRSSAGNVALSGFPDIVTGDVVVVSQFFNGSASVAFVGVPYEGGGVVELSLHFSLLTGSEPELSSHSSALVIESDSGKAACL